MADPPPDNSIAWHLYVGCLTTGIPATIFVALRFFARHLGDIPLKADDWLIAGSLVSVWTMVGIRFSQIEYYQLGRHTYYAEEWQIEDFKKSFLAVQVAYFMTATFTRSSILFFYRRIFVSQVFLGIVWIVLGMVLGFFIGCSVAAVFGCQPVSYYWNSDQDGHCMNEILFYRLNGIINLSLDLLVLILPLPLLWQLQMYTRKKIALSLIFSLGLFACLCSAFRLLQFQNPKWKAGQDPLWAFVHAGVWSSIEQSVGVICACLPCLRILITSKRWETGTARQTAPSTAYVNRSDKSDTQRFPRFRPMPDASGSEIELTASLGGTQKSSAFVVEADEYASLEHATTGLESKDGIWRTQEVRQESVSASVDDR